MTKTLQEGLNSGRLTRSQLRELIEEEARELGLSYDQAIERAREGKLPRNVVGSDLSLLISLLNYRRP
jgi:hypothetical protein